MTIWTYKLINPSGKESEKYYIYICEMLLYDPMDCSPPGSSVCAIFQARMLEWIAISFSRGSSQPRQGSNLSLLHLLLSRWIIYQCAT